ncbi:5-carboxymethyl-2-hydroxymuconate Delta-isomerase [Paraburkholderia sp.]|uniref:5-carboxymethyl-2-hydroxymuconate Delta-isomerase n=1 Tax=Paraburkholderia sp. TaxID=1926495 RepID=UPI003D6F2F85
MPHLTLEYSSNLADEDSIRRLCEKLTRCLDAQRDGDAHVYPLGGIRVRALRCEQYFIADGRPDAAFLHANLKIGSGRSESVKKATGDALFELIKQHFATEFDAQGLALSMEISEFSETGTWKHNNLHARLKA